MSLDFRSLLLALEDRLGTCHVLVNRQAKEPAVILLETGIHDALVKTLARAIYKSNRCYHVRAAVSEPATLAALLKVRAQVLENPATDWATAQFLDRVDEAVRRVFAVARQPGTPCPAPALPAAPVSAQVLAFPGAASVRAA